MEPCGLPHMIYVGKLNLCHSQTRTVFWCLAIHMYHFSQFYATSLPSPLPSHGILANSTCCLHRLFIIDYHPYLLCLLGTNTLRCAAYVFDCFALLRNNIIF